jgi:predicted RNase H-like nuclease (RuvC/YqgF family)
MLRDLVLLPGVPRRMLDDIGELKELVREQLLTAQELTRTSQSTDRKVSGLETTNRLLEQALDELRALNSELHQVDTRVERLEREIRLLRGQLGEITALLPDLRGPVAKAKDALTGD